MERPTRILLVQLQWLGDVVLTAPLLEDLREAFPAATIDFLTGEPAATLVRGNPYLSKLWIYDRAHPVRTVRAVRSRAYDWVIDVQSSPRTAPLTLLSGARRRVGWRVRGPRRFAYTDHLSRCPRDEYVVRQRQRFLERLGVPIRPRLPRIFLDAEECARGADALRAAAHPNGAPCVGLVLSARAAGSTWPAERYAALARRLCADGCVPIVIGTVGDEAAVSQFLAEAPGVVRADLPELRLFAAFLRALDLLVSGDTGPAHIATAVGTPTITLYGAARPAQWNPGLPTTVAVTSPQRRCNACARGIIRTAPEHTCMLEIEVEDVYARVRTLLQETAGQHR